MSPGSITLAVVALAAVLALVRLGAFALRRGWIPRAGLGLNTLARRTTIVECMRLDARRQLHLVQCEGRRVLILTGGPQDLVVGWVPGEPG
ncbi:MAG TPA: hypothetical protein VHS58_00315 [Acetobacteraceae bacterium]|jgi:flagellar protein FliO/FliZ|nr:hypothetical protein [Acetobacteraceae bacterium]